MNTSIFLHNRRFSVSMLAVEAYAVSTAKITTEEELYDVLVNILTQYCGVMSPNKEDFDYLISRLKMVKEEIEERKALLESESPSGEKNNFSTSYQKYINALPLDSIILKMVNYDMSQGKSIYCTLDRDDALRLVKDYIRGLMETNIILMESVLFGNGGKYKDAAGIPDGSVVWDLRTEEGKNMVKQLGF